MTKTKKDGSRGRLRIDYGDHRNPQDALTWQWKFVDGARTAGDLYGRALVVIVAEQHASRLVVAQSQRMPRTRWGSHKDNSAKAPAKLAKGHLPTMLKQLDRAVMQTHAAFEQAEAEQRTTCKATTVSAADTGAGDQERSPDELEDLSTTSGALRFGCARIAARDYRGRDDG